MVHVIIIALINQRMCFATEVTLELIPDFKI